MSRTLTQDQLRCFEVLDFMKDGRWCRQKYAMCGDAALPLGSPNADRNCFYGAWAHLYGVAAARALPIPDEIFEINDSAATFDELAARMQQAFGITMTSAQRETE